MIRIDERRKRMKDLNSHCINQKEIFHAHTWRCGHAGEEREEAYVKKAIQLGAKSITFTDHAPFPGDPFRSRMKMEQLADYKNTIWNLKEKYGEKIHVQIGLEIEYLPGYRTYYETLKEDEQIEFLMIGQHFYEIEPGSYSFLAKSDAKKADGIIQAEIEGVESGLFSCVAHPDRGYRYAKNIADVDHSLAKVLIDTAKEHHVLLEKNVSSMERNCFYPDEFWKFSHENYLVGVDAHSVEEMERRYRYAAFV